jgi:hypothetical protein
VNVLMSIFFTSSIVFMALVDLFTGNNFFDKNVEKNDEEFLSYKFGSPNNFFDL